MNEKSTRNIALDCAKGLAIILVCLGHIMQATTSDYYDTKIYNLIYALQMPVFFLISGILSSSKIETSEQLRKKVCKRACVYLIPFISRIVIFNPIFWKTQSTIWEEICRILISVDSGLWFLWVLFFLCVNCDVAVFFTKSIKNRNNRIILESGIYFALLIPWIVELFVFKVNYLGAKLIIYYSVFYFLGRVSKHLSNTRLIKGKRIREVAVAILACIGMYIVSHYRLFIDVDSIEIIILRVLSGVCLSYVFLNFTNIYANQLSKLGFSTLGRYTLEIYYVHGLAYSLLTSEDLPKVYSIQGISTIFASIVITAVITYVVIIFIKSNKMMDFIFFGKKGL